MRVAFITKPFQVELLGIAYLASVLKKRGHDCKLILTNDLYPKLKYYDPQILAYSVTSGVHKYYQELNLHISKPSQRSVFGGPHPTYFPEFLRERGVDCIVRGEAENSIHLALERYREGNKIRIDPAPLIQDLDSIPFPDREFLYTYPENRNNLIKNVMTSRGCPFSCPYCFNSVYRKMYEGQRWVRFRSPENVLEECEQLVKNYPTKMIFFQDDEFICNPKLKEFLSGYKQRVRIPFHCQLRIELLTEEKARLLKEAGCYSVTFAVESGDTWIREYLLNRKVSYERIVSGAELLHRVGLRFRVENMVGIPTEKLKQMLRTLKLNQFLKPTIGWCSIFQPYPNLPLSDYAKRSKLWNGEMDYEESFFERTILNIETKREVENLQKLFSFFVKYQTPLWLVRMLIKLPLERIYKIIFKRVKQKCYEELYNQGG